MADLAITSDGISIVFSEQAEIRDIKAAEAITKGQAIYRTAANRSGIAEADVVGKQQFRGIALKTAKAGEICPVLKRGYLSGYDLSGMNFDAKVFLSDTPGTLADTASVTKTVVCGRVDGLTDDTKLLYVDADWLNDW